MVFLLQRIHSITRRIIFKIILKNYFCTEIKILLFDLMKIIFSCIFYWIQMGSIFNLYYKFKVKGKVRWVFLNVFNGHKSIDSVPTARGLMVKS